ncbi:hypothetical protein D3C84_1180530 [compost metagenome]
MLACRLLQREQTFAIQVDRVQPQPGVKLTRQRHVSARLEPPDPDRVARYIGFGKYQQDGTRVGGLVDQANRLRNRLVPI